MKTATANRAAARTRADIATVPAHVTRPVALTRPQSPVRAVSPGEADAAFLAEMGERTRLRRSRTGRTWLRIRDRAPKLRRAIMVLILLAGLGMFAAVGTADTAKAFPVIDTWCTDWRVEQNKESARDGIVSYGDTGNPVGTTFSKYGLAGINWDVFWVECSSFGTWIMGGISDMLFSLPMLLSGLVITFFQWTFEGHIINVFIKPGPSGGASALDTIIEALHATMFMAFLGLMAVIAGLVLLWRNVIRGAGLADALGKVAAMALVGGFAMYIGAPGEYNASYMVRTFNDTTNDIMGVTFAAFSQATCDVVPGTSKADCTKGGQDTGVSDDKPVVSCVDSEMENGKPKIVKVTSVDCIGQVMYHALIFTPWATGELGPLVPADKENGQDLSEKEFTKDYQERIGLAFKILRWQAYSRPEVDAINKGNVQAVPETGELVAAGDGPYKKGNFLGEKLKGENHDCYYNHPKEKAFEVLMNDFSQGPNMRKKAQELNSKKSPSEAHDDDSDERLTEEDKIKEEEFLWNMCELAHPKRVDGNAWKIFTFDLEGTFGIDEAPTAFDPIYETVAENRRDEFNVFTGRAMMHRFQTAMLALIAGMAMALIVLAIAIAYLVLQIATVAFAMMAPLAALIGLIPVFGIRIFLKWLELFLGTFLKRIGLAVFVGFLMTLYTMILSMPFQWYMQLATLIGIALVGLVYRKKVLEMAGMEGVEKGMRMGQTAAAKGAWAGAKGGVKGAVGTYKGARKFGARYKGAMEANENKLSGGRFAGRIGGIRQRLTALGAASRGGGGKFGMELEQARYAGTSKGRQAAERNNWVDDTDRASAKSGARDARVRAIQDTRRRRDQGESVRLRSRRLRKRAEKGQVRTEQVRLPGGGTEEQVVYRTRGRGRTKSAQKGGAVRQVRRRRW